MRNLKKVLTLVLTLAMLLSVMVVGAGAATFGDQDSITNKEAVDVCTTLNIIGGYEDGTFRPAGNVTRAEMSKMICVALNGGKEPTMGSNLIATFNDVAKDNWAAPYIEYCVSQGIVGGVGGGNFNPNGNITGTQAAKMLLCILGYNASIAGYVGSDYWETNINVDAAQKGLYEGLTNIDASAPLTRDSAARMIANALDAYEVEYITTLVTGPNGELTSKVTVQDKVVAATKDKITLLEDKYEANTAVGIFNGDSNVQSGLDDGNIEIINAKINGEDITGDSDFVFKYDLDLKYLGEEIKVLYRDNKEGANGILDSKDTIYGVYVTGATTVYNITKNDLQSVKSGDTDVIRFGDKDYKVAAPTNGSVYIDKNYGGAKTTATVPSDNAATVATALNALKATSADTVKLVCDNSGKITKAYVVEYKLARVTAVNADNVSLNNSVGTIKIADNDVYDGIAKDDIVVVTTLYKPTPTTSGAYNIVTKAETVEGKLTAYNGTKSVSVDGTTYDLYDSFVGNKAINSSDFTDTFANQVGETVRLYLINGIGYAAEMISEASRYAVIEDQTGTSLGETFDPIKAKIMKTDGTEATVELHKDSTTDGSTSITASSDIPTGALIKYSEVSDGKIKVTEVSSVISNTIAAVSNPAPATVNKVYDKSTKSFATTANGTNAGTLTVTSAETIVFVNRNGDFYHYNVRNLNDISVVGEDDGATTVTYDTSTILDDGKVVVAYVTLDSKPSGASSTTVYGIVSSENGTTKVDDDTYTSYTVQVDDNRDNDQLVLIEGADDTTLKEGDLVAFDVASDNVYSAQDITIYAKVRTSTFSTDNSAVAAYVDEYDEKGQILSYFTAVNEVSAPFTGDSTTFTTKAVDDDVKIVYVDAEDDIAAASSGVNEFDGVKGKKNVVVVFDENNTTKPIVAIFVDVNNNIEQ